MNRYLLRLSNSQSNGHRNTLKVALRWIATLCLAVLLLGSSWIQYQRAQEWKALVQSPLVQRALQLSSAVAGPTELGGIPTVLEDQARTRASNPGRTLMVVPCRAASQTLYMVFNTSARRLAYILSDSPVQAVRSGQEASNALNTPAQAAEMALARLTQLQLVGENAQIALEGQPEAARIGSAWQVNWKVQPEGGRPSYRIKMTLDRKAGIPLLVVDTGSAALHLNGAS